MKHVKRGFVLLIGVLTAVFLLLSFLDRRQKISVYENRSLAAHPAFSPEGLWDGSYFRGWDDYFSDHVYHRDDRMREYQWLRLHVKRATITNGVVITPEALLPELPFQNLSGYDFERPAKAAAKRLAALQQQVEAAGSVFLYLGVDEQRTALADRYPSYLYNKSDYYEGMGSAFRAACEAAGVHTLFLRDRLNPGGDLLPWYSAVDHHYNLRGAYGAYRALCEDLMPELDNLFVPEEEALGISPLPGEFWGAYNRRLYDLSPITEQLLVFDSSILPPYLRWDNGERTDAPVLELPAPGERINYTVYMGGDKAETVIQTDRPELPSILIVGDSFTNPVEALCVCNFNEIRSLDFRHYTELSLTEYLALHPVDAVVVIRDNLNYVETAGNGALQ